VNSQGPHIAAFAEAYCRHTKGRWAGEPVVFEEWQREFLDEAFRLDKRGRRVYQRVLFGISRKNGKSTLAASLSLYLAGADGEAGAEVIIAAGSRDQAAVVYDQARAFVDASDDLTRHFETQRYVILGPDGSVIKRIAADGKLQHGLNPSAIVVDELHSFQTPRQEELWNALTTATGAREQPLTLAITTAGYDRQSVLGRLYAAGIRMKDTEMRPGLTIARDEDSCFLLWWYGLRDQDDPTDTDLWMACNPASWIDMDVLQAQHDSPTVDELAFQRLHLNKWTSTRSSWLPAGLWESLNEPGATIPDGAEVYMALDVGLVHDSTALAVAWKRDDGRILVQATIWAARDDAVAHHTLPGGRVDLEVVKEAIRAAGERWAVQEVVYDPRFAEQMMHELADETGMVIAPVDQSSRRMKDALATFYVSAKEERILPVGADGADPILSAHVEATQAVMTERGWKISRQRLQRIDGCVASAMAVWRAERAPKPADYVLAWDDIS
jgi:phage terminase large subunit-like protein